MCYKENKSLFFLTPSKMTKLFIQKFVIFNIIIESFLVEKCGTYKEVRL